MGGQARRSAIMAPKQRVPDAYTPVSKAIVRGWPFRVRGDGMVTVGTASSGQFKRFTFQLSTYPEDSEDPSQCVIAEIDNRNTPARAAAIGQLTPRFGPLYEGQLRSCTLDC